MKVLDYERDFILDPSLALYLPLWKKDGSVIASEDRHGHSCTVTGPVWRPQGRAFDGTDDYIAISHNAGIALGAAISIVGWVYSTEIVGHSSLQYVIADKSTWPDAGWTFFVINQKLKLQTLDGSAHGATGASIFPINEWVHVAGVTDGTNTYVYLNGEKDGGPSSCGILTDDGNTFTLSHGDSRYTWVGSIGELAVYNRALTALDIRNHREATKWRYK